MIGIDTNLLLRFVLADDPVQSPKARALVERYGGTADSLRLTDVVLAEMTWVLRRLYRFDPATLVKTIEKLLADPAFAFSSRPRVQQALAAARGTPLGFADCLIAQDNAEAGCEFTATFDRKMRTLRGVKIL